MKYCKISRTQTEVLIDNKATKMQVKHLYHDREEISRPYSVTLNISTRTNC
ncbi:hypothetical protein O9993_09845 [Vibrio lentus]|nr:hypothetical protein [Vibrio lentus]